jgi:hypothetical protein
MCGFIAECGRGTEANPNAGLLFSLLGLAGEAMIEEPAGQQNSNPQSRCEPVDSSTEEAIEPKNMDTSWFSLFRKLI